MAPSLDISEPDKLCCPLEWRTVYFGTGTTIDPSQGKLEAITAITVDTSGGGFYLQRGDDLNSLTFLLTSFDRNESDNRSILMNPYDCTILWVDHESKSKKRKNKHFYIPLVEGMSISRSLQKKYRYEYSRRSLSSEIYVAELSSLFQRNTIKSQDLCADDDGYKCEIEGRSILHIDCMASMKTQLYARLQSIDFDPSLVEDNSLSLRLAPQEIINKANSSIRGIYHAEILLPVSLNIALQLPDYSFIKYLAEHNDIDNYLDSHKNSSIFRPLKSPVNEAALKDLHRLPWKMNDAEYEAALKMHENISMEKMKATG